MTAASMIGPDIVVAGVARSGTSSLVEQLGTHPQIDAGKLKEPNYFSRHYGKGADWYDTLFGPRQPDVLRLDASVSYTSPLYPEALKRLAAAAPDPFVVYVVRDPMQRSYSHYLFRSRYFRVEAAADFGAALRTSSYYNEVSDYSRWIPELKATFPRLLVVPFEKVTSSSHEVATVVCRQLGLAEPPKLPGDVAHQRNNVVEYKGERVRRAASVLRQSRLYPRLRGMIGATHTRRLRGLLTRQARLPSFEVALASCDAEQIQQLKELQQLAGGAVSDYLAEQDRRLDLSWQQACFAGDSR